MPISSIRRPAAAGVIGYAAFLLIGWGGILIPSLIRSVKEAFGQSDAGIGVFYFLFACVWAAGSFGGGFATERLGRRTVLTAAVACVAIGMTGMGLAPSWTVFLLAALPAGLGSGAIDGGGNALVLDLAPDSRGRALNLLHLFFSLGALAGPLAVGRLVEGGVGWELIVVGTGLAAIPIAVGFGLVAMPGGRRARAAGSRFVRPTLAAPLILLAFAIACYVGSEVGVSNWLVRFLEPAPLSVATTTLSLYWAGLAVGRLVSSQLADRFDHLRFATVCAGAMAVAVAGAIFAPSLPLSIGLFAVAGFASGPIFPMIIAIGGERYPDRSAAVSGFLSGCAVAGALIYPPVMGFLSVTVGLTVAMFGNVILGLACAGALVLVARRPRSGEPAALSVETVAEVGRAG